MIMDENNRYREIFYKNFFTTIARKRGMKTTTEWCEQHNLNRSLIYKAAWAQKRESSQSFATILQLCNLVEMDLRELLREDLFLEKKEINKTDEMLEEQK